MIFMFFRCCKRNIFGLFVVILVMNICNVFDFFDEEYVLNYVLGLYFNIENENYVV